MMLSISIAAVAGTVTLLDLVAYRPLPVAAPHQLVLFGTGQERGVSRSAMPSTDLFSYPHFKALREEASALQGVAGICSYDTVATIQSTDLAGVPATGPAVVRLVSDNYFTVMNVIPAAGTFLSPATDGASSDPRVAVLSFAFWRDRMAKNPAAVGSTIRLRGNTYTIIGVASQAFEGETVGRPPDLWIPLTAQPFIFNEPSMLAESSTYWILLIGRLKPGLTVASAAGPTSDTFRRISQTTTPIPGQELSTAERATVDHVRQRRRSAGGQSCVTAIRMGDASSVGSVDVARSGTSHDRVALGDGCLGIVGGRHRAGSAVVVVCAFQPNDAEPAVGSCD
jgi:hypothetical protein